jgi:hypothetical protein
LKRGARAASWLGVAVLWARAASADPSAGPILHEPIRPDAAEDLAMHVVLDGDLPAAVLTSGGAVSAPEPRAPPSPIETAYGAQTERDDFRADRDPTGTSRDYDDPFVPSTAPFKRMVAFDAVRPDYDLYIQNPSLAAITSSSEPGADDDAFFMDALVDIAPGVRVRIPSVGPGARIVRGRLGVGAQNVSYVVSRDGADNWYVEGFGPRGRLRARLVLEVAIPRSTFGGPLADASWAELPPAPALPPHVAGDAAEVCKAIGVSRAMRPREAVAKLTEYFRGFSESDTPIAPRGSVYSDIAQSKKGVCRHRAFAFMITALELGIPARLAENDVHAWVEVHDGVAWRRIDLGGAGRLTSRENEDEARPVYRAPADAFPWPPGARRSDTRDGRTAGGSNGGKPSPGAAASPSANPAGPAPIQDPAASASSGPENRPASSISIALVDEGVRRGGALHARGSVRSDGAPCAGVDLDVHLRNRETQRLTLLGTLATGDDGAFDGSLVVPSSTLVGDYDVIAKTAGNARCGRGQN